MSRYESYFYSKRYEWTAQAAGRILDLVLPRIPPVRSALDVGCGGRSVGVHRRLLAGMGSAESISD